MASTTRATRASRKVQTSIGTTVSPNHVPVTPQGHSLKDLIQQSFQMKVKSKTLPLLRELREKQSSRMESGWLHKLVSNNDKEEDTMMFMFLRALLVDSFENSGYLEALCHSWGVTQSCETGDSLDCASALATIFGHDALEAQTKRMMIDSFSESDGSPMELYRRLTEEQTDDGWLHLEFNNGRGHGKW